jgi:primary-amine oxidase
MATDGLTTGHMRPDRSETSSRATPHPLDQLSVVEANLAREAILTARGPQVAIHFRSIFLEEPPKKELLKFLDLEHSGMLTARTPRPARVAKVQYDVVRGNQNHEYTESWVNVISGKEVERRVVDKIHHASLTTYDASYLLFRSLLTLYRHEFRAFTEACFASPLYKKAIAEFDLPEGFVVTIDPVSISISPHLHQQTCYFLSKHEAF